MRRAESRGFSLLEVLIALVVLAFALVALTRTASGEVEAFAAQRSRTLAGWVAANALGELRLRPGVPAIGREEGHSELGGRRWRYRIDIAATPAQGVRRLSVAVWPEDDPRESDPLFTLEGFKGDVLP